MNRAPEFTPRSESAWTVACAAALPPDALQILIEARARGGRQVDAAAAFIAFKEQKTESQTRSKARREAVKGWGTGEVLRDDETEQIDPLSMPHGMGCRRRSKFEPPCRPNIEPGVEADFERVGCG